MRPAYRLILNTSATYLRSVIGAGLALFSSRWILSALGQSDFGLFSLVGSILIFIAFLNSVMAGSSSRHYAYALGQGDPEEVNRWFNTAISIHLCLALILTLCGWISGEYLISNVLTIPDIRLDTCHLVFRISLISLFTGMTAVPFTAMFRAKQSIAELSLWDIALSSSNFIFAYLLLQFNGDRLKIYAIGITSILATYHCGQIIRATIAFKECKFNFNRWFNKGRANEIFSFAAWNLIGNLGTTLRDQGTAVLLNLYFGPRINAAYGIAKQVSSQTGQLAGAMLGAFSPEITSREGRGDREGMLTLSLRASKFGTLLILIFFVPLMMELDYVLHLWLISPPPYTTTLCRLILCTFLIDRLTTGYMLAINAYGRIALYQATVGTTLLLTLPIAWLILHLGARPNGIGIAFILTMIGCSCGRIFWAKRLLNSPVFAWIKKVAIPCLLTGSITTIITTFIFISFDPGFKRLLLTTITSLTVYAPTTWLLALDKNEKKFVKTNLNKLLGKIRTFL